MNDEWGFLKHETLTTAAEKFKFPAYKLVNLWRENGAVNENLDGIFAKWQTVDPDDTLDNDFVAPETQSRPLDLTKRGWQSAQMLVSFNHKYFPAEIYGNVEGAESLVASELEIMRKVKGDLLDEYMLAKTLLGSCAVTLDGQSVTMTTAVQTATAGTAWSTNTADIANDVETAIQAIGNYGYQAGIVLTTGKVFNAMKANTVVKDYLARNGVGQEAFVRGEIPDLFGLRWIKHDLTYKSSGSRTRFLTEGKAIFIPTPAREWTEFQVGKVAVGGTETVQGGIPSFPMVNGFAAWATKETNPPGFTLFGRYARLPVIKVPNAVYVFTTGVS